MIGLNLSAIDADFRPLDPVERLLLLRHVSGTFVVTTSLGLEDQVLLHLIVEPGIAVDVVTLNTGRLFPETSEPWARTESRCGLHLIDGHPVPHPKDRLPGRAGA